MTKLGQGVRSEGTLPYLADKEIKDLVTGAKSLAHEITYLFSSPFKIKNLGCVQKKIIIHLAGYSASRKITGRISGQISRNKYRRLASLVRSNLIFFIILNLYLPKIDSLKF